MGHPDIQKQVLSDGKICDGSIFTTSLVPLELKEAASGRTVWKNPTPSSTRLCRPISFYFAKETPAFVKTHVEGIMAEVSRLVASKFEISGKGFSVTHCLVLSMINGKVANVLLDNRSTTTCPICEATPSIMNNLEEVRKRTVNPESLNYGISPLHTRINTMECILKIAANMSFKNWTCSKENTPQRDQRKAEMKEAFRTQLGLILFETLPGAGTSHDGNTARRLFLNYSTTTQITGVDERLIFRLYIILKTINCNRVIDFEAFTRYCAETAELFVSLYGWYHMPVTVHRILIGNWQLNPTTKKMNAFLFSISRAGGR